MPRLLSTFFPFRHSVTTLSFRGTGIDLNSLSVISDIRGFVITVMNLPVPQQQDNSGTGEQLSPAQDKPCRADFVPQSARVPV
jgi:hypothetical protein